MADGVKCSLIGHFIRRKDKSNLIWMWKTHSIKCYNKSIMWLHMSQTRSWGYILLFMLLSGDLKLVEWIFWKIYWYVSVHVRVNDVSWDWWRRGRCHRGDWDLPFQGNFMRYLWGEISLRWRDIQCCIYMSLGMLLSWSASGGKDDNPPSIVAE